MDPRTDRTRQHVLRWALQLLAEDGAAAVTFSTVARAARVSRQTLYRHWQTREQLIAEAMTQRHTETPIPPQPPEQYLEAFLRSVRDGIREPAIEAALAGLISSATHNESSSETLRAVTAERRAALAEGYGPLSGDEFARIVGPIFFQQLIARQPVDDTFLEELVTQIFHSEKGGR